MSGARPKMAPSGHVPAVQPGEAWGTHPGRKERVRESRQAGEPARYGVRELEAT